MTSIAFGTQYLKGKEGRDIFRTAWEAGFRNFDTALAYANLELLGEVLKNVAKSDHFSLVVKISRPAIEQQSVLACTESLLRQLQLDYIDVILIHAPKGVNHEKAMNELLELKHKGIVSKIGLSNYTLNHLEFLSSLSLIPDVLQVEIHPFLQENRLVDYCNARKIDVMAHTALAHGEVFKSTFLQELAKDLRYSLAQLVLHWSMARGLTPVMSSLNAKHIMQNALKLPQDFPYDLVAKFAHLDQGLRICNNTDWAEFDFTIE